MLGEGTIKGNHKIIISVLGLAFLVSMVVSFLNYLFCDFATEIRAYTANINNTYYWGPKYCPQLWSFKSMNEQKLEELRSGEDFSIVTLKENTVIEKAVENKYLGYNIITAEGGESSFVIYQINCQSCKK